MAGTDDEDAFSGELGTVPTEHVGQGVTEVLAHLVCADGLEAAGADGVAGLVRAGRVDHCTRERFSDPSC